MVLDRILLMAITLFGRCAKDSLPVIDHLLAGVEPYTPVGPLARPLGSLDQPPLPLRLKLGDPILFEQLPPLAIVIRHARQVRTAFTGKWRLDIDLVGGIEKRKELVVFLLTDGIV